VKLFHSSEATKQYRRADEAIFSIHENTQKQTPGIVKLDQPTEVSYDEAPNDYWVRGCRSACCHDRRQRAVARAFDRPFHRICRHDVA
jgi:hypothetical protein